jgi:SAM-dependent methyltransferase
MSTPDATHDANLIPAKEMLHDGSSSPEELSCSAKAFAVLHPARFSLPTAAVLDLGCGNGSVARALTTFLTAAGRYEGVDVNGATVAWLARALRGTPNFHFTHANVYNRLYTRGPAGPGSYRFPS